jgi:hypothetical protein
VTLHGVTQTFVLARAGLRRLEEEQRAFEDFLARLREAKDKAEFDQFMDARARKPRNTDSEPGTEAA